MEFLSLAMMSASAVQFMGVGVVCGTRCGEGMKSVSVCYILLVHYTSLDRWNSEGILILAYDACLCSSTHGVGGVGLNGHDSIVLRCILKIDSM